jgi:hypothetical protein
MKSGRQTFGRQRLMDRTNKQGTCIQSRGLMTIVKLRVFARISKENLPLALAMAERYSAFGMVVPGTRVCM